MAWPVINRNESPVDLKGPAVLGEAVREKIRSFFPRYATKRAVMLPALHVVQAALGHVSWKAMAEIAEVLEVHPSDVFDTLSFYTYFWTQPKGEKVITCCRNISCEIMGGKEVLEAFKKALKIGEHETTPDGKYTLVTEECLAACDHAPCVLINEKLHKCVRPGDVTRLLADERNARIEFARSDLFDAPKGQDAESGNGQADASMSTGNEAGAIATAHA